MRFETAFADLWDYRSRVSDLYRRVREGHEGGHAAAAEVCRQFRQSKDALFRSHPQSALDEGQTSAFDGLAYFDHDPALRFLLPIETDVEPEILEFQLSEDGLVRAQRFGRVRFSIGEQACALSLFWLLGYGGGVFLPFRDATAGHETYGGGRYLLDTIKHADLGRVGELAVIDFNYAYNPSCAYNARWVCPPSPPENDIGPAIRAGERALRPHG
jgi:uncharacterized protein (DUF1684 family)